MMKTFIEFLEGKDACYHKVKSRYRVWPSAYSSGALVKCRKMGAANWGNSKNEALQHPKQYDDAANAIMGLQYNGVDASSASSDVIIKTLISMGRSPPEDTSMEIFAARIKSVAKENTRKEDFTEGTFDTEKEKGLHGWFSRNKGKGWIDCKASRKGNLVPCGRNKTGKGAERKYPACRPTLSSCNKSKNKKKSSKPISWKMKNKENMKKYSEWYNDRIASLSEAAAVCARCGNPGKASEYDINAGKARCRDCGGTMHKTHGSPSQFVRPTVKTK